MKGALSVSVHLAVDQITIRTKIFLWERACSAKACARRHFASSDTPPSRACSLRQKTLVTHKKADIAVGFVLFCHDYQMVSVQS